MKGMQAMLRKEWLEVRSTSRLWVLPAIIVVCAVVAPVLTYFLPRLAPGQTVDSSVLAACTNFFSFLSSLVVLSIISTTSGMVSSEVRNGTAMLVVTKPVSRQAFVLSKMMSQCFVVIAGTIVGAAVFATLAYALFGTVPLAKVAAATGMWLLLALFYTVVMVVLSARIGATAAVGGIGVGIYIVFSILGMSDRVRMSTPAGIGRVVENILREGPSDWLWPTLTALVLIAVFASLSGRAFARREI